MSQNTTTADGELILFWLLPALGVTWLAACVIFPGFSPPMSPTWSAEAVAAFYRDPSHTASIRISMVLFNWFCVGMIPFLALLITQIHRMAHHTPIWSYAYIGCMAGGPTLLFTADLFWLVAAFRPERAPALTQMYNDIAWVAFAAQAGFLVAQCVFLAVAIYLDHQARPIFKKWVAHFNLLTAAALAPATFSAVTLSGPIAWDGVLSFWVKNGAVVTWFAVMTVVLGKTLYAQRRPAGVVS
ncbi:MAG: hypothetical protein ABW321_06300 [Polyangiales bacterium]